MTHSCPTRLSSDLGLGTDRDPPCAARRARLAGRRLTILRCVVPGGTVCSGARICQTIRQPLGSSSMSVLPMPRAVALVAAFVLLAACSPEVGSEEWCAEKIGRAHV